MTGSAGANPPHEVFSHPCYIRARHRYAFRSGEWAEICGVKLANLRPCFLVLFDDGKTDLWPIADAAAQYEFSHKQLKPHP